MITENLSTLKIHKLTQAQYDRELEAGRLDESALYLTPDEETDLSGYATKEYVDDSISAVAQDTFGTVFYESLAQAVADINNGVNDNAIQDSSIAKVKVFTADNGTLTVMLLDNISESVQIDINKDIDLVLNGKTITFPDETAYLSFNTGTNCKIDGTVDGSAIYKTANNAAAASTTQAILANGKMLAIKGGTYSIDSENFSHCLMCIKVGNFNDILELDGCTVKATNSGETSAASSSARTIQALSARTVIKNSTIKVDAVKNCEAILATDLRMDNCTVDGILRATTGNYKTRAVVLQKNHSVIKNSKIHADAIDVHVGNPYSRGLVLETDSSLVIENTNVTGTHSGMATGRGAKAYVKGGIFTGYCHGGFYFSHGQAGIAYVNDAVIKCGNYDGIFDYSGKEDIYGSFYVGGNEGDEKYSNITVYLDNCTIGEGFVLRGTSNEQNNTVNISNSTILNDERYRLIRIDNETHKVNIGVGTNIATSMIDNPQWAEFTSQLYRRLYDGQICDKDDYEALVRLNINTGGTYYTSLSQAVSDINNDTSSNSVTDSSTAKVKVFTTEDGVLTVKLLDNISESTKIDINKDIDLVLNGKTLEFTGNNSYLSFNTGTSCNINGEIDGSKIIKNIENLTANSTVQAILGNGEKLTVKGGSYFIIGNVSHILMTFKVGGTNSLFELDNCIVKATNTDEVLRAGICSARAIQSMAIKTIIKNSDIQSDAINECNAIKSVNFIVDNCVVNAITRNTKQNTAAFSIVNHGNSIIKNSKIHSDAPFDGRDVNLSKSMGIDNEETGTLLIEDTDVTASYYAVYLKPNSKTYVKGGIFTGYSCGGFYLGQGQNSETYIKDAVIRCGNYDGIFDYSGNVTSESGYKVSPFTSFQVSYNYGKIYLDGCMIGEPGYTSFLINGQNNEVNISNSTIVNGAKPITIYGNTNKLNIGINTNITTSIITAPSYANFTDKLYRKLHKNEICGGNDFNTFVNFLNSQVNKTIVSDDGNGNVIVSGLSTASVGQGG